MSECLICKGEKLSNSKYGIVCVELDNFLYEQGTKIWDDMKKTWTIKVKGKDIDFYLTEAQEEINLGVAFENTEFYSIMVELLKSGIKVAMWYATYSEDLPLCESEKEVLNACYNGIVDESGMCEVYFKMC